MGIRTPTDFLRTIDFADYKPMTGTCPAGTASELGGDRGISPEVEQVQSGDFSEMRQYLAHTRQERDWQDRYFLLNLVAPSVQIDALTAASAAEPNAADLMLLLGVYYCDMVGQSRGARVAEQTSEEQFNDAHLQIQRMMEHLLKVYSLDPDDPTPHVSAMRGLVVFTPYQDTLKQEYAAAIRIAPDCLPAHYTMLNARSKKWGGSHEEALHIARGAMKAGKPGSDLPACLFLAHFLVWQYARIFDKNKSEADSYLKNRSVNQELNQALDRWIDDSYKAHRSSIPYLHQTALWYYLSGDYVRLKRVLTLTGGTSCDYIWKQIGDSTKTYGAALQKAASAPVKKTGLAGMA